jgi:hypothetical protein
LQLYADGGYQLRIRSLEGTPNYGPRQEPFADTDTVYKVFAECPKKVIDKEPFADKVFAEYKMAFTECLRHSAKNVSPVVRSRTIRPLAADRPRFRREQRRRFSSQ